MRRTRPPLPVRSKVSLLLRQRRRRRRRVGGLDVVPAQGLLVSQLDVAVAGLGGRPCSPGFDKEIPVRLVRRQALTELRRLMVDLACALAEAEGLRLELDARLVHQGLSVDRVGAK